MSQERAKRFIDALAQLEEKGDVEPLARLHAEDAEVSNAVTERTFAGPDGARAFWREYKGILTTAKSTFRNVITAGDRVALEWETQGTAHNGAPINYEGVSIVEWDGEHITRFYAYFNPQVLEEELARGA